MTPDDVHGPHPRALATGLPHAGLLVLLLQSFDVPFLLFEVDLARLFLLSQSGELRLDVLLQGPERVTASKRFPRKSCFLTS